MSSRMDKYENDTPELKRRTEKNASLYRNDQVDDFNKFDINSNISVLKNDARSIDVNQIREMLDKKYRDNLPQRKSIAIEETPTEEPEKDEDTKEYDINAILNKAKENKKIDYNEERLNHLGNSNLKLIDEINKKYSKEDNTEDEKELVNLINTITALETKNQEKTTTDLLDLKSDGDTTILPPGSNLEKEDEQVNTDTFYTGKLKINDKDYDDFKDIEDDIKSNSILTKILIVIFILIIIAVAVVLANKYLKLGLF